VGGRATIGAGSRQQRSCHSRQHWLPRAHLGAPLCCCRCRWRQHWRGPGEHYRIADHADVRCVSSCTPRAGAVPCGRHSSACQAHHVHTQPCLHPIASGNHAQRSALGHSVLLRQCMPSHATQQASTAPRKDHITGAACSFSHGADTCPAVFCESLRLVLMQQLMEGMKLHPMEVGLALPHGGQGGRGASMTWSPCRRRRWRWRCAAVGA